MCLSRSGESPYEKRGTVTNVRSTAFLPWQHGRPEQCLLLIQPSKLLNNNLEIDEQRSVLFLFAVAVEVPSLLIELFVEASKQRELDVVGDCHVVLDGVETSECEVKDTDLYYVETWEERDEKAQELVKDVYVRTRRNQLSAYSPPPSPPI